MVEGKDKPPSKAEAKAAIQVVMAVGDAIRELGSIPSGHLYAQLMSKLDLQAYQRVIDLLKGAGVVKEEASHMLTWIGPKG